MSSHIKPKCLDSQHSWRCIDGWSDVVCRSSTPGALTFSVKYQKYICEKCGEVKIEDDKYTLP